MDISQITLYLLILSIAVSVVLFVLMAVRARKQKKSGIPTKKLAISIISVILVLLMGINGAVFAFNNIISQYLSSVQVDDLAVDEATQAAKDVSRRIAEEGIVLLENKNQSLPLDLSANNRVNLFGMASISLVYGGSGSGASDESQNVTLQQGLKNAGFEVNDALTTFYEDHKPKTEETNIFNLKGGDYNIYEPAVGEYSQELLNSAKEFSDTAIVVISRSGGEGGDLPMDMAEYTGGDAGKHYLELQTVEREMLQMVEERFEKTIVIINSSNAMELGFLEDAQVDAALWIGGPGSTGCDAAGKILSGDVNPSGRLADIYAYDVTSAPAYYNAGNFFYTSGGEKTTSKYVEYAEGIYVGYRYYETRYVNNTTGQCDEAAYASAVQYPFGYGLSYTKFTQELVSHKEEAGNLITEVKVTNTGSVAGKEVVQLYFTAPYTVGGVEKAHVVLAAFGKTGLLEPGASETLTLSFSVEEMASYDYANNGAYVLNAGVYEIKLMNNSHDVIDSYSYTVEKTEVYGEENPRATDTVAAVNVFADAAGEASYVSRADWEGTLPTQRVESKDASAELLYALDYKNINELYCANDPEAEPITTGAKNGVKLEDMIGLPYEDEAWEALLDQLTVEEMSKLIGFGGFSTVAVSSVDKASTIDIDGPAGLNALTSDISGVQYPSEVVIASTFNVELVEQMGQVYAQEAHAHGVNGVYAPAANIHRTPFSGRNFEYYSEDPLLSGKIGAAEAKGLNALGICTYVKHFALNDQETNRSGVAVWSNEQAIREIYLKAFEYIVKEGGIDCMMTSYNRIGAVWAGGHSGLITQVLRGEWGFQGTVITDYDNGKYMNTDQALRAGGDMMLSTIGHTPSEVTTQSNYGLQQMRRASKNILYTVVNSRAYTDPVVMCQPYWLYALIAVNVLAFAVLTVAVMKKTSVKTCRIVKAE